MIYLCHIYSTTKQQLNYVEKFNLFDAKLFSKTKKKQTKIDDVIIWEF